MKAIRRAHAYTTFGIALPMGLLYFLTSMHPTAFLVPFWGPYCLHLGNEWNHGWPYTEGTASLARYLTGLLLIALIVQFIPKLKSPLREIRVMVWAVCWFLWCASSFLMILSTLG
jgi:hypothetical protein